MANNEKRGYPDHLIKVIQSLYKNTTVRMENNCIRNKKKIFRNQGVKQGCSLSPTSFNIYIDTAIQKWQSTLTEHFKRQDIILYTLLFADDQVIFSSSEDDLQMAAHKL